MHPSVEQLLKVQRVDSDMRFLQEARRLRPQELQDDKKKVDAAQAAVDAVAADIKRLRLDVDRGELEVKQGDAEIEKTNIALNSAQTNQEYSVLKEQIRRHEEERGGKEEEVLDLLGQIDSLTERRGALQTELEAAQRAYARREAEVGEILQGLDQQLAELKKTRDELARDVDEEHLSLYERILGHRGDAAVSLVKDAICQGCFMSVTSQSINLLMIGEELVQCKNCGRLLYLE